MYILKWIFFYQLGRYSRTTKHLDFIFQKLEEERGKVSEKKNVWENTLKTNISIKYQFYCTDFTKE